jgi:hypothetical protein
MTKRKKAPDLASVKGFRTSEHPAKRMAELFKLPPDQWAERLHAIVRSDANRYTQVAKRRVAELAAAELERE